MAYFLRTFCTSVDLPTLREVFTSAENRGIQLVTSTDLDASAWQQAEIVYKPGRQPFVVEADSGEFIEEEVAEFIELLEDVEDSPAKERVLAHLGRTRAVIAAQILSDVDDEGYSAVQTFLNYFVDRCGGLIQADGEGFYEGDELVVELSDAHADDAIAAHDWIEIGFHGDENDDRTWTIPRTTLAALAAILRNAAESGISEPSRPFETSAAEELAELIDPSDAAVVSWTAAYRPVFRWALNEWMENQANPPAWAAQLRKDLSR
jgi:hypothetical protein